MRAQPAALSPGVARTGPELHPPAPEPARDLLTTLGTAAREADSLRGVHIRQPYPLLFQVDASAYEPLLRRTDDVSSMIDHCAPRFCRELRGSRNPGGLDGTPVGGMLTASGQRRRHAGAC